MESETGVGWRGEEVFLVCVGDGISVRAKKCCAVDLTRRGALLLRNGEGGVNSLVGGERGAWWGGRVGGRRRLDLRGVKGRRLAWTRRVAETEAQDGGGGFLKAGGEVVCFRSSGR